MKLPKSFVDGLSERDKQLAEKGFEQAKKQMLAKIKAHWNELEETDEKNMEVEQDYFGALEWLESELK